MEELKPVLVIIGAWNTPLFSYKWINDNLYDAKLAGNISSELVVYYDRLSVKRYKLNNIVFEVNPNKLVFKCDQNDSESLSWIIDMANEILTKLPHTPVESFGVNVSIIRDEIIANCFEMGLISGFANDSKLKLSTGYVASDNNSKKLNVDITINESNTSYEFNFHHIVSDIGIIKQFLVNDIFVTSRALADKFIKEFEEKNGRKT